MTEAITELLLAGQGQPVRPRELVIGELAAWATHRNRREPVHRFAAHPDLQLRRPVAERLVTAAREALPTTDAVIARRILAADLALLTDLDTQVTAAETELAALLPTSPFATLTTAPGWAVVRTSNYAAALCDPDRWPGPRQIYHASGISPMQYESAGRRRDGSISREGSVALRRALIDLGIGL